MVQTHTHTDIAAISSRMLPKRQNMDFPQTSKNFYQVLFHILLFCSLVYADLPYPPYQKCTGNTTDTLFLNNLGNLFESIASTASIGNGPDTVYGQFMCYKYVVKDSCQKCLASATTDMKYHCPDSTEAVLWEEECQLRYANFPLLGKLNVAGNIPLYNNKTVDEPEQFRNVVNETLHNITKMAAFNRSYSMYATTNVPFLDTQTISALVQCTVDLSADDCNSCLEVAISNILSSGRYKFRGARLLSRSCYLRYEFYAWFPGENETQDSNNGKKKRMTVGLGIGIGIGSTISVLLLVLCIYFYARRSQTKNKLNSEFTVSGDVQLSTAPRNDMGYLNKNLQATDNLNLQELPFIDMKTINEATDNFSDLNKLGQGGFGPVYKGILPSGEEVAVKRLSLCSEQGSNEFINEVELILKLQHKNLVRLLGFCMHQEEKLLVYEFMPNRSLDVFLLDCRLRAQLNWDKRIDIINGIARGMLYLHQDSRLRIIHRDLKPSNVLLDKDMNPKISDFGMAKIFIGTDGEANTALIVGTYGYMAPEFAMEGLYSVKSDVFSFGVVLLEIITGRRNSEFRQSKLSTSLQAYAWNHWNEGKGIELMDPLLSDSCYIDEFLRYMHIGLLCVQEDAYDRPTMSSVVVMLSSEMASLLQPKKPAFFVGRLTDHETCYNNLSVNNLTMSNIVPR